VSISGTSTEFVRPGDEGTSATFRFCPNCGATVYYTTSGMEDVVGNPGGLVRGSVVPGASLLGIRRAHARLDAPAWRNRAHGMNYATPIPSIERASSRRLRRPKAAHVGRWAS
jgi:hypothetical protein